MTAERQSGLSADFWKFWTGQVISTLGSSFTQFAIPLLIFRLTHSSINLALTMAASMLPYLFFGLFIGAWVDRLDRKQVMIVTNVLMALTIGSIPALNAAGHLAVPWIYGVTFVNSTLFIFFSSSEFAAIPSLVGSDDLVTANGRIQASYNAANVAGPILAGALAALVAIPNLLVIDAVSYLVSAASLLLVGISFNTAEREERTSVRADVVEGLRYVLSHPVLRSISAMMALVNFVGTTTAAQMVLFAKDHLHATNTELGLLFGVEGLAMVLFSLFAGQFRKRWSFSTVALGCLFLSGLFMLIFALMPTYWLALPFLALSSGVASLFNINTGSLRQVIVPNHLLGRVMSIAGVLAWSAIPLGALAGGEAIQWTGNVVLVYAVVGIMTMIIPATFSLTALGHAERYLPAPGEEEKVAAGPASA